MRKFGRVAESAVAFVEHFDGRLHNRLHDLWRHITAASGKRLGLRDRVGDEVGLLDDFTILFAIGLRDGGQHALEIRTAVLILWREVSSAVKRFALEGEDTGQ